MLSEEAAEVSDFCSSVFCNFSNVDLCICLNVVSCLEICRCLQDHLKYMFSGKSKGKLSVINNNNTLLYTVSHKKCATLFLIITLAFLGRFLYFCHRDSPL